MDLGCVWVESNGSLRTYVRQLQKKRQNTRLFQLRLWSSASVSRGRWNMDMIYRPAADPISVPLLSTRDSILMSLWLNSVQDGSLISGRIEYDWKLKSASVVMFFVASDSSCHWIYWKRKKTRCFLCFRPFLYRDHLSYTPGTGKLVN